MKKIIALLLVLVMTVCLFSACNTEEKPDPQKEPEVKNYGKIFYVAIDGDDTNEGTKESPLATLGGAVAKVREYKQTNGLPEGGIKVEFAAGTYKLTAQTELTADDSGEAGKEIVYAAADGAEVIFDGGITLSAADFKPANDEFKALLQTNEAKANVIEIDLAAAGIWDADDSASYTPGWGASTYRQTLYVNNEIQTPARWPNGEYYKAVFPDDAAEGTVILFPEEKATLWANETNIRAYGYPEYDWSSYFFWNLAMNPGTSLLNVNTKFKKGQTIYVFNIASELDEPGEYYWDVAANKLYYWPKDGFENAKINFSQLVKSAVILSNTEHITFDGLTFENLRYNAIAATANYVTVSNCLFRCISASPVTINGSNNTIIDNEFCNLGGGAISVSGGDIAKQIPSNTLVTNNCIHDWSQVYTVYNAGITTSGLGFVLSHNDLYNSPHEAIAFNSGLTTIEYNEIYNVCTETFDAGAIYAGRRWDWGNDDIRFNYIHDQHSANGIYLDDTMAKITCYGNIIVNVDGNAFALGGGRNLTIYNNILINTSGIGLDGRGYGWYPTVTSYPDGYLWTQNMGANYLTDLWKYRHPEYLSILEMRTTEELKELKGIDGDLLDSPAPPSYANIYGNIGYNNDGAAIAERGAYIFNRIRYLALNNNEDGSSPTSPKIEYSAYPFGNIANNLEYLENELADVFVNPSDNNFFLKEDSRVYRDIYGFIRWDYSLIGIQK